MATDGVRIFINPGFLASLDWDQMTFVFAHEIMHNLYRHIQREHYVPYKYDNKYNHKRANYAQDYEINWGLEEEMFPSGTAKSIGGLIDERYGGLDWEIIYEMVGPRENPERDDEGNLPADGSVTQDDQIPNATNDPGQVITKEQGDKLATAARDGEDANGISSETVQRSWDDAIKKNKGLISEISEKSLADGMKRIIASMR